MATSLLSPLSAPPSAAVDSIQGRQAGAFNAGIPNTFLHGTKVVAAPPLSSGRLKSQGRFKSAYAKASNHVPKQFRQQNLKDGLMDNFKNVPHYLYGLSPAQMDMFMTEDNPARRQSEKVTEQSISSANNYLNHGGMYSMSGMDGKGPSQYSMSVSMYRGGARGNGRPRTAPPDLPSLLLDARICYLGMPIVPAVTELLVAQFMWLDYDNPSKPIYLYINSSGTQNEKMESVGSETEAYAIADMMSYVKSDVYTVNCGMAYGQAALLLSLGAKGYRAAKELDANTEYYIELLAKGTGKSKEELSKDVRRPKYFQAQEAIEYGIVDKIIDSRDAAFEKRVLFSMQIFFPLISLLRLLQVLKENFFAQNYDEMLSQSRAMRRGAVGGPQAAPSGLR
ncbi:hypothetical protein C1H46_009035 [Malus baccata]|uniref:ATP-dependent Clp protease proteolytic subunit n=1 Tax=Malus baccata TaxID=106549 RepID=A0A540N2T4_MALBA|nr:hypothetical protein C1H46_009035 [Malus baccata]